MIGIVDYGMGNLQSVKNSLEYLGEDCEFCVNPRSLAQVDKIILPGVGSFPDCVANLRNLGFFESLHESVIEQKKPILGICLGMQVMATVGQEMGNTPGLGWFDAAVIRMETGFPNVKIPNVGWENVHVKEESILYKSFHNKSPEFYFVHSYYMNCKFDEDVRSWYQFGDIKVTASVQKDNIFGTQFHPEKSSDFGREVLLNFIDF